MPVQNKVVWNIPQELTDEQMEQARSNIGAAAAADLTNPVVFISNTGSGVPTLAQVQGLIDTDKYVVLQYDDGVSGHQPRPMLMLTDDRGGTPNVVFGEIVASGAYCVTLDSNGFGAMETVHFDADKIETISVANGATTLSNASVIFSGLSAIGKIPIIKYDETGSGAWGYYWLSQVTDTDYVFARVYGSGVRTIGVTISTGSLTYGSLLFSTGTLEVFTITNLQSTVSGIYNDMTVAVTAGKTPVVKYEEATNPQVWGCYWLMHTEANLFKFGRVTGTGVLFIDVNNADAVTYTSVSYGSATINCIMPIKKDGAGNITNNGYSVIVEGANAWGEGNFTRAHGDYSHSEGKQSVAWAESSHAEGGGGAYGDYSHAEGSAFAINSGTHAEGNGGTDSYYGGLALGFNAHVEGTQPSYYCTVAEASTINVIPVSDATGVVAGMWAAVLPSGDSTTVQTTTVTSVSGTNVTTTDAVNVGRGDHVVFSSYAAAGNHSHIEGQRTRAKGRAAHAEGYSCNADGDYSHSGGNGCQSIGTGTFTQGGGLTCRQSYGASVGQFNEDEYCFFSVGVGTAGNARADALKVDANGHVWIRKNGTMVDLSI